MIPRVREVAVQCDVYDTAVWHSVEVAGKHATASKCTFIRERGVQTGEAVSDANEVQRPGLPPVRCATSKGSSREAMGSARSVSTRGRVVSDMTSERAASSSARGRFFTDPTEEERRRICNGENFESDMWAVRLCAATNETNLKAHNLEGRLKKLNALATDALSSSRKARWDLSFCEISTIEAQLEIPRRRTTSQTIKHAACSKSPKEHKSPRKLLVTNIDHVDSANGCDVFGFGKTQLSESRWPPMQKPPVSGKNVMCYASPVSTCFGNALRR